MHLLSTGKHTIISSFADLETKSSYSHANGESTDFQFNGQQRVFIELNRKSGLEVMRAKSRNDQELEIQRVRKLSVENVNSIACAKQSLSDFAIGQTNGQLRLYNYKTAEIIHRFQSDNPKSSVIFLDYNCTDEYIASVLENGDIHFYGIKTKTRLDTMKIDGMSTLARFHPNKRFQLSIASYKGAITAYDMQMKRRLFHMNDAHDAACRDLAMCTGCPHTLLSVGFDCKINIYDVRRKVQTPVRIDCTHPLSTVALSDCGTFFCVGNLKGELTTYDMRHTKACLITKKVHDGSVVRVAFVPKTDESSGSSFNTNSTASTNVTTGMVRSMSSKIEEALSFSEQDSATQVVVHQPSPTRQDCFVNSAAIRSRDSFPEFLDIQTCKDFDPVVNRRDSFDWETLKPGEEKRSSLGSVYHADKGNSPVNSFAAVSEESDSSMLNLSYINFRPRYMQNEQLKKLKQIEEEQHASSIESSPSSSQDKYTTPKNKETRVNFEVASPYKSYTEENVFESKTTPTVITTVPTECTFDIQKEIERINQRIQTLQFEMTSLAEFSRIDLRTQAMELHNKQKKTTREMLSAMAMILQRDQVCRENFQLRRENTVLRKELQHLRLKNGENIN